MKKAVVIIPNYNGENYIQNCLESLLPQQYDVILIENASTDSSVEICKRYASEYQNRVKLILMDQNTGFCHAVNRGIEEAKGQYEYAILLNNDTVVEQGFCQALVTRMDTDSRIFSASARMINLYDRHLMDDAGDYYCALGWAFSDACGKPIEDYEKTREVFSACGGAAIYRMSIIEEIGMFDENHFAYLEDLDLGYRAKLHGYRNVYEPNARVYHAGSGVSGSKHNAFKVNLSSANSVYVIYKNMCLLQILLNFPLLVAGIMIKQIFFIRKKLGIVYCRGISRGIIRCFTKEGRKHKVKFTGNMWENACKIQLELWRNLWKRIR